MKFCLLSIKEASNDIIFDRNYVFWDLNLTVGKWAGLHENGWVRKIRIG